jgi:hypothetical protein
VILKNNWNKGSFEKNNHRSEAIKNVFNKINKSINTNINVSRYGGGNRNELKKWLPKPFIIIRKKE